MKSRVELWKDYRNEINNNIQLQKAVQHSNEKLSILYRRLVEVFPDYEKKYSMELSKITVHTNEAPRAPRYSSAGIDLILEDLASVNDDNSSVNAAIDKIDFSSHELDDVIMDMEQRKSLTRHHVIDAEEAKKGDIIMANTRLINIGGLPTKPIEKTATQEINMPKLDRKINIAIDGPSGSGKSTVAKELAKLFGLKYINTGLVYRAIALNAIEEGADLSKADEVISTIKDGMIELGDNESVVLNGMNVSKAVRADEVSQGASKVASIPKVREWAVALQKFYGKQAGTIMDGRDTTFKIMPNADLKIFLDTSAEVRAQRRVNQNKELGYGVDYETILSEIKERDTRDRTRDIDPLHKTEDAVLIDASNMTIKEVVEEIAKLAKEKM